MSEDLAPFPITATVIDWLSARVPWVKWKPCAGFEAWGRLEHDPGRVFLISVSQKAAGRSLVSVIYYESSGPPAVTVSLCQETGPPLEALEGAQLLGGREAFEAAWLPVVEARALLLAAALSRGPRGTA